MIYLLTFIDNNIGDEGAKAIGEVLKTNTTLSEISLYITTIIFNMIYYDLITYRQ